jgi:beta-lactamase class A
MVCPNGTSGARPDFPGRAVDNDLPGTEYGQAQGGQRAERGAARRSRGEAAGRSRGRETMTGRTPPANRVKYAAALGAAFALFAGGFLAGREHARRASREPAPQPVVEFRLDPHGFGYRFIDPLLSCGPASETNQNRELKSFRDKVQRFIDDAKKRDLATHVSVCFRELNEGLAFSIAGEERFSPASLLKVPDMMAYFKWAESDPGLLQKRLTFDLPDANRLQNYKPARALAPGASYTVDDLIFRSIVYSDNNAARLLQRNITSEMLFKVYRDLGLPVHLNNVGDEEMTVNDYAAFFKILFNASYLTKDFSEKALRFLAEPDFPDGISAGTPKHVVVAQKFGERTYPDRSGENQLHDCGIVYYAGHPYLLCIMSRGKTFEHLAGTIRDISKIVYDEVERCYGPQAR